ncbi:hypothetical protein RclHR1_08110003 [Rhizophagus clarus]|uniref:Uncharacterized protein n=1 Tax=Rhizophagus clarus TaxID=94130 RepID=A0A2Z6S6F1_9GLOM|nr:hypothetical protein RclHR1_08110003 [Rhizophagus clarus]
MSISTGAPTDAHTNKLANRWKTSDIRMFIAQVGKHQQNVDEILKDVPSVTALITIDSIDGIKRKVLKSTEDDDENNVKKMKKYEEGKLNIEGFEF